MFFPSLTPARTGNNSRQSTPRGHGLQFQVFFLFSWSGLAPSPEELSDQRHFGTPLLASVVTFLFEVAGLAITQDGLGCLTFPQW